MGLFDSTGPASGPAEVELAEHLETHPMLTIIEGIILNQDDKWISKRTDYYDSGERTVHIGTDCFRISTKRRELGFYTNNLGECRLQLDDTAPEAIFVAFTDYIFEPLHIYKASNGKTVNENRVVYLWALTVQKLLREKIPDADFNFVTDAGKCGIKAFTYKLPELKTLDWLKQD